MPVTLGALARTLAMFALIAAPVIAASEEFTAERRATGADPVPESFQSPSGNIQCYLSDPYADPPGSNFVTCRILEFTSNLPVTATDCGADWGGVLTLDETGIVRSSCQDDPTPRSVAPVLDYGHSVQVGDITCRSGHKGVTCQTDQGRGFTLSRRHQEAF